VQYGAKLGVNVLTFNYRGVGHSTGWPFNAIDLVKDAQAAVEYLKNVKVRTPYVL
jgi:alpha/beta superfamily hydrolase